MAALSCTYGRRRRSRAPGLLASAALFALAFPAAHGEDASDAARMMRLAHLVAEGTWYQRSEAADALSHAGTQAAVAGQLLRDTAVTAIGQQNWRLAHLAIDTLAAVAPGKLGDCSAPLDTVLGSGDTEAAKQALHLIVQLGHAAAPLAPRLATLTKDKALGVEALRALLSVGGTTDAAPIFQDAIKSSDPDTVLYAIEGYAALGPKEPATIPALISVIGDARYANAALRALQDMGAAAAAAVPAILNAQQQFKGPNRAPYVHALRAIETDDMPPTCADISTACVEGHTVRMPLQASDPDDMPSELRAAISPAQLHGNLALEHFCTVYTATYGWVGSETAAVVVSDHAKQSVTAHLTVKVTPDTEPASLVAVSLAATNHAVVHLAFNKPLQQASAEQATAYAILPDVTVVSAKLGPTGTAVDLTTSGVQPEHTYTMSVQGVLDTAASPVACAIRARPFLATARIPGLAVTWFSDEHFTTATTTDVVPQLSFPDGPRPHAEHYSARYSGWLIADTDAAYTLTLSSDDGSRLWLDDLMVIDNWGTHPLQDKSAQVTLKRGELHHLRVDYFQIATGECLRLLWSRTGVPAAPIPPSAFTHDG